MGLFRFVLALLVVFQHIATVHFVGASAVFTFFVLSGYLMTHVVSRTYGYSLAGFGAFWKNRILRLYPAYFVVIFLTALLILFLGTGLSSSFHRALFLPDTPVAWFTNLTMLFDPLLPLSVEPRLAPATWALTIELFCYFLISLGVTRTERRTMIWMAIGLIWIAWAILFSGDAKAYGYASVPAAFFPFAVGAMLFHRREEITRRVSGAVGALPFVSVLEARGMSRPAIMITLALVILVCVSFFRSFVVRDLGLATLSIPIHLLIVIPAVIGVVGCLEWRPSTSWLRQANDWGGDFSYPLYLCHWGVALAVAAVISDAESLRGFRSFQLLAASLPPMMLLCWIIVVFVDRPINRMRDGIRARVATA